MPLGTEVNLGPGYSMLDGVAGSQLPLKGTQPPVFGSCLLRPNGWMDEDATWTEVDLGPSYIVLDRVPAPRERGTAAPSLFCLNFHLGPFFSITLLLYVN